MKVKSVSADVDEETSLPIVVQSRIAGIADLRRFAEQMRSFTGRWLGFVRFRATALELVADYLIDLPAFPSLGMEQFLRD